MQDAIRVYTDEDLAQEIRVMQVIYQEKWSGALDILKECAIKSRLRTHLSYSVPNQELKYMSFYGFGTSSLALEVASCMRYAFCPRLLVVCNTSEYLFEGILTLCEEDVEAIEQIFISLFKCDIGFVGLDEYMGACMVSCIQRIIGAESVNGNFLCLECDGIREDFYSALVKKEYALAADVNPAIDLFDMAENIVLNIQHQSADNTLEHTSVSDSNTNEGHQILRGHMPVGTWIRTLELPGSPALNDEAPFSSHRPPYDVHAILVHNGTVNFLVRRQTQISSTSSDDTAPIL